MGFTLIDFVEGFHFMKARKRFSAGTQSCYFAILTEFQLAGLPSELPLSTRELKELAGLKSVSATHEARNILKNNKLVDFKTVGGVTVYRLGTEHLPNTYRTLTEQSTEHPAEQQGLVCYTPTQENGVGSTLPLPPTPPIPNPKKETMSQQASQQAGLAEDVVELWERKTGTKLEDGEKVALRTFDELYGRETIKVAIATYAYKKGRKFSFFVEWCLKPLLASSSVKGGEDNGEARTNQPAQGKGRFDDEEPDTDWIHSSQTKD